jgi:ActR/RegA family two-component response regulator
MIHARTDLKSFYADAARLLTSSSRLPLCSSSSPKSPKFNELRSRYETQQTQPEEPRNTGETKLSRILIVDDHITVRQGIAMMVEREPGLSACCAAGDIEHALEANRICPHDLAIIDITLDNQSGLDLAKMLSQEFPDLRILMLSMHDEQDYAVASLLAGAHGYLMKETASRMLPIAIRQVLNGELYTSDTVNSLVLENTLFTPQSLPMPVPVEA